MIVIHNLTSICTQIRDAPSSKMYKVNNITDELFILNQSYKVLNSQ